MKARITILLVFFSGLLRAQTITTAEYFYDTDPGFGKGTLITLNSATLDSTLNFASPNLPAGAHTLYVRLKNSANAWSTVYQQNFLLTDGSSGPTVITAAEYYYDTDPGFGKGTDIALNSATLDSTLTFAAPNLPAGAHTLYVRLKSSSGSWSTVYQGNFLLTTGAAGASTIVGAEYFYDKDPGVGNGSRLTLNNAKLDSTINFPDNGLSQGIHTLFIRLLNNNNQWSITYPSNVNISGGTAGSPAISRLEYFFDKDSGINKNTLLTLNGGSLIDTTLSILLPDNGASYRVLGLRLSDETGMMGNVALDSVSFCSLLKPKGGFRVTQYGNTFTLFDTSQNNTSDQIRWQVNGVPFGSSYMVNYTYPADSIGTRQVTEITGSGCRLDTVSAYISNQGVESYSPSYGSYGSDLDLTVYGGGLDSNTTVYLENGGNTVYPYAKYSFLDERLDLYFDFHSFTKTIVGSQNQYENYTLHVNFSNGLQYVGPIPISMQSVAAVTVCNSPLPDVTCPPANGNGEPWFAAQMSGPAGFRTGQWNTLTFNLTNTGTVAGKEIPFFILLPSYFEIDTTQWTLVGNFIGMQDSLSIIVPLDTIINGQHIQYNLVAMMQPVLGAGESVQIPLRIRTTYVGGSDILYWAGERYFGSPANLLLGDCGGLAFDYVLGYVPVAGQISAVWDWGWSVGSAVTDLEFHLIYGDPLHPGKTLGSFALNTGGMLVSLGTAGIGSGGLRKEVSAAIATMAEKKAETAILTGLSGTVSTAVTFLQTATDNPCPPLNDPGSPIQTFLNTVTAFDPNRLSGNSDYDTAKHWIRNYTPQFYQASFENAATASANAQHVYVTDTFNTSKFVYSTFALTEFSINDSVYYLPPFRKSITMDVGLKSRQDMKVRFVAAFDSTTGIMRADLFSIDTAGNVWPLSSTDGFLPPDVDGVSGTASVSYSMYARALNTLDTFSTQAHIFFDNNVPIATNTWMNTVDTTAPVSRIVAATPVNDSTVRLTIQQSDVGSGNWINTLYEKRPTDTVFTSLGTFAGDTVRFVGQPDSTYQLYVAGTDNVGNVQSHAAVADITTTLGKDTAIIPPGFNIRITPNPVIQSMQIRNNGLDELIVQIFDILGRQVLTTTAAVGTTTVDMGGYANGVYIVRLTDMGNSSTVMVKILKL